MLFFFKFQGVVSEPRAPIDRCLSGHPRFLNGGPSSVGVITSHLAHFVLQRGGCKPADAGDRPFQVLRGLGVPGVSAGNTVDVLPSALPAAVHTCLHCSGNVRRSIFLGALATEA